MNDLEDLKRQSKQNEINAAWLIKVVDEIHSNLCPGKSGTWQDRARQAVVASRKIAEVKTSWSKIISMED